MSGFFFFFLGSNKKCWIQNKNNKKKNGKQNWFRSVRLEIQCGCLDLLEKMNNLAGKVFTRYS